MNPSIDPIMYIFKLTLDLVPSPLGTNYVEQQHWKFLHQERMKPHPFLTKELPASQAITVTIT